MDSSLTSSPSSEGPIEKDSMVDPFLVEALQNPRHRLTVLRMELDIQRFLQNLDQQQFEFQHLATSYLRLAAHRVAQHYGLQTGVQAWQDTPAVSDGQGSKIIVKKSGESKFPAVRLSEIPAKKAESKKPEQMKITIRRRPNIFNEANESGTKQSPPRTVAERKEEYDRARARIFSAPSSPDREDILSQTQTDTRSLCSSREENGGCRNTMNDLEKNFTRDISSSSRVAIFRDREKDRTDPDYDRSYERYVRNLPINQSYNSPPFSMQKVQVPHMQYDGGLFQLGQIPQTQASLGYRLPASPPPMNLFCATGLNQASMDAAAYMQWPSPAMMYAHSYEHFRHAVFQAPFCQLPLSFDYSQNH